MTMTSSRTPGSRFSEVCLLLFFLSLHVQGSRHFIFLSVKEHLGNDCLELLRHAPLTWLCPLFPRGSTQPHSHRQEDTIRSHFLLWKHIPWFVNIFFFPSISVAAGLMSHTGTGLWIFCGYPLTSYCILPRVLKLFNKILSRFHVALLCPALPQLRGLGTAEEMEAV